MNQKTFSLTAQNRDDNKYSARSAREERKVPAVVYGPDFQPLKIQVEYSDMLRTYREAGKSALIDLDTGGKTIKVLVQELSLHPVTGEIHHVDFYAVNLKKKTNVDIPLTFVGESNAVKNLGALFMKENESIEIRCLPTDILQEIEVDISGLKEIGNQITVADIKLDTEKFEVLDDPEKLICSAVAPREEEIEEPEPEEGKEGEGETKEDTENKEESEEKKEESADEKKEEKSND